MSKTPSEFTENTKEVLARRAGQRCSNPSCGRPTSVAHTDANRAIMLGEAAHIFGKNPGSKRFDPNMTDEQRGSITNGIWLCSTCHKLIDTDEAKYKSAILFSWKSENEKQILESAISKQTVKNPALIPVLDLYHVIGSTGGPKGHFRTFKVISKTDSYAQDCSFWLEGFGYRHDFQVTPGLSLGKDQTVDLKIEMEINETTNPPEKIDDLEFNMSYSGIDGTRFVSKRKINQFAVKTNIFNDFSLGKFIPPAIVQDDNFRIEKFEKLDNLGGGETGLFSIDVGGEKKQVKIKISSTLLATWGFTKDSQVLAALLKIGEVKIRGMIQLDNLNDYTFTTYDFPNDYQSGYEGFKKACYLLER